MNRSATKEPREIAEKVSDKTIRVAQTIFGSWHEETLPPTEPRLKNLLVEKINLLNTDLKAERIDEDSSYPGQKPDIYLYEKTKSCQPFIVLEAMKKKATATMWKEHIERNYDSESGITIYTNGIKFKTYFNHSHYFDFDFNIERHRILFTSLLENYNTLTQIKPKFQYIELLKIEKEYSKRISKLLNETPKCRELFVYLISIASLEHSRFLNTNFTDKISENKNPDQALQDLLVKQQELPILEELRKKAKDSSDEVVDRGSLCKRLLSFEDKIVSFRNIDAYVFSRLYEKAFTVKERKSKGIFTTPKSICSYIAKKAYKDLTYNELRSNDKIYEMALVDLSCGSGNFLEAILDVIFEDIEYGDMGKGIERRRRYNFTVYGKDINIEAVSLAETAIILAQYTREFHPEHKKSPINLKIEFSVGDGTKESEIQNISDKYDYVLFLGNPPFTKQTNMGDAVVTKKSGKKNLGTLFLESMLNCSVSRQVIGIVYQMALFGSQCKDAESLMNEKDLHVNHFIYFGQSRLFTDLEPHKWCSFVISNQTPKRTYKHIASIENRLKLNEIDSKIKNNIHTQIEMQLVDELKLSNYLSFRMVSCFDRELASILCSFPMNGLKYEAGIQASKEFFKVGKGKEEETKNCFQVDEDFKSRISSNEVKFLKPYWNEKKGYNEIEIKSHNCYLIDIPKTEFSNEEQFAKSAPNLYKHLVQFKNELLKSRERKQGKLFFWNLHWPRGGRIYQKNKIIIPQILNWKYKYLAYLDDYGVGVPNKFNIIKSQNIYRENWAKALVGWLNSGIIAFYCNGMNGAKPRGPGGELTGELISALPIPRFVLIESDDNSKEKLVSQMIKAVENRSQQTVIDRISTEILMVEIQDREYDKELEILHKSNWLKSA